MTIAEGSAPVVVAGIDFSEPSEMALDEALRIAGEHSGATLHVVHVISSYGPMLQLELEGDKRTVTAEEANEIVSQRIADRAAALAQSGTTTPEHLSVELRGGNAADQIVLAAAERDADLIVIGTHGRTGVRRFLLGSIAEAIVKSAGTSVLVVRSKAYEEPAP